MAKREYKERIAEFHDLERDDLYPEYPWKGLHIELSNICNHQCLFCANRKMTRKKGFIDENFLKRILKEAYEQGFREVGYYANGEPFVSERLDDYIRWAKETGYTYVYIDTNGAATDFSRIKEVIDAGLDSIKFSINGTERANYELIHGRDDFDKVIENLKQTYEYKQKLERPLKVFVSIAVTKYTESSVSEFSAFCRRYCDDIVTNYVIEMGGYLTEELQYLRPEQGTADFIHGMAIPCYQIWNGLFVTYEGYATACCADFQNYFVYADLNRSTIREAWHNEVITNLRRRHLEKRIEGLPCMTCAYGKTASWEPLLKEYATMCDPDVLQGHDIEKRIKDYEQRGHV